MRQPWSQQARCHTPQPSKLVLSGVESINKAQKSHGFELDRTEWCALLGVRGLVTALFRCGYRVKPSKPSKKRGQVPALQGVLPSNGYAERSYITAGVKGSPGDCVFTCSKQREIHHVNLVAAISDPILRENRRPSRAVYARIRLLDLPSRIVNGKYDAHTVAR